MKRKLLVKDMNCAHCEAKIKKEFAEVANTNIEIDLDNQIVTVQSDLSNDDLIKIVKDAGYTVSEIN